MNKKIVMESLSSKDERQNGFLKSIRGCVECRDKMGNLLFKKDNVITRAGKFFLLEKLLGFVDFTQNSSNLLKIQRGKIGTNGLEPDMGISKTLVDRQLCAFAIGSGGISTASTVGEVKAPSYKDTTLYEPLLFKIENSNFEKDNLSGYTYNQYMPIDADCLYSQNPDLYKEERLSENYRANGTDRKLLSDLKFINSYIQAPVEVISSESGGNAYKLKGLQNGFEFVIDENKDEVHIKFELTIHETDLDCYTAEYRKFNELGLYIANVQGAYGDILDGISTDEIPGYTEVSDTYPATDGNSNVFSKEIKNPELFSHITFNNMDLSSSQEVTFTYYIYIL